MSNYSVCGFIESSITYLVYIYDLVHVPTTCATWRVQIEASFINRMYFAWAGDTCLRELENRLWSFWSGRLQCKCVNVYCMYARTSFAKSYPSQLQLWQHNWKKWQLSFKNFQRKIISYPFYTRDTLQHGRCVLKR